MLGQECLERKDVRRAIEYFDALLALTPEHVNGLNQHAIASPMLSDFEDAARFFALAVDYAPNDARKRCNLDNAMRDANKHADALSHFERALELQPSLLEAALAVADLRAHAGRHADALTAYEHAESLAPD
ncbi:TPR domain protein, putative component of TonB system [Candidatus Burkholderia pumila]|uniref:TPR domain protein, putative component of TonB system n=1 Tax=Candidatus Burkholderia pumila TaxID=1090375 RepID=A0ABR5HN97_9BURK|nr:TPR domain protein, putative component of TonB system [Candidatus Burkholderia pumila]